MPDFINFVTRLNNDFGTGVTTSVQMGIEEASEEAEEDEEEEEEEGEEQTGEEPDRSTGTIRMIIYTYQGA